MVQLLKKLMRREGESEAQREGQSLKGVTYGDHYTIVFSKTLSTAPQTHPYRCHKSRLKYIAYLDTANTLDEGP